MRTPSATEVSLTGFNPFVNRASTPVKGAVRTERQSEGATEIRGAYTGQGASAGSGASPFCCGAPAGAAPELLKGLPDRGQLQVDNKCPSRKGKGSPLQGRAYHSPSPVPPERQGAPREAYGDAPWRGGGRFFQDEERESWARFLQWALTRKGDAWFATLTFKNYTIPRKARGMRNRWLARLNQALKDSQGAGGLGSAPRGMVKPRLRWFSATEWQLRDVIHFHLLVLGWGLDILSRKRWEYRWQEAGGGWCRLYNADVKAAPYLAKYLNKDRGGELELGGSWLGYHSPGSVGWHSPTARKA